MDKLILCTSAEEAIFLTKFPKLRNIENTTTIAFNSEIEYILESTGIPFKNYNEYLDSKASEKVYKKSLELSEIFINDPSLKPVLIFHKVSYLEAIESDLPIFFLKILKDVEIISSLIRIENPSQIISIYPDSHFNGFEPEDNKSYLNKIAKIVCNKFDIAYKVLLNKNQKLPQKKPLIRVLAKHFGKILRKIEDYKVFKEDDKIPVLAYQPDYFSNVYHKLKKNASFEATRLNASVSHSKVQIDRKL